MVILRKRSFSGDDENVTQSNSAMIAEHFGLLNKSSLSLINFTRKYSVTNVR